MLTVFMKQTGVLHVGSVTCGFKSSLFFGMETSLSGYRAGLKTQKVKYKTLIICVC